MQLVHLFLFCFPLFMFGGIQSDDICETFDGYDIDPGNYYDHIQTEFGAETCCTYCINGHTGCTAYSIILYPPNYTCYFKNITELRQRMTPINSSVKVAIVRRSNTHSFTSPEYIKRQEVSELPEINENNSAAVHIVGGVVAVCMLLVIMGLLLITSTMRKRRMELTSAIDEGPSDGTKENHGFSGVSPKSVSAATPGRLPADKKNIGADVEPMVSVKSTYH